MSALLLLAWIAGYGVFAFFHFRRLPAQNDRNTKNVIRILLTIVLHFLLLTAGVLLIESAV